MAVAYLHARIDPCAGKVIEYRICAEARPLLSVQTTSTVFVEVLQAGGKDFAEAQAALWDFLDGQPSDAPYGYIRRWLEAKRLRPRKGFSGSADE